MKNNKYKILVLSDLKKTADITLTSGVSLAKMIDAEITLFHVKKHIDIVGSDNQLSAIRALNEEHNSTKNNIEALVKSLSKEYNVTVNGSYAFGKIKDEISNQIKLINPDVIVLGQRDSNPLQLIGDGIIRFVLKEFKGVVMISANENTLVPNKKMKLGVLNKNNFETKFSKDLLTYTESPLKSFKIINSQQEVLKTTVDNEEKVVEYVFEQNANTMTTLSSYLSKNSINLLCVDRTKNKENKTQNTALKEVLNNLNVSILISETK